MTYYSMKNFKSHLIYIKLSKLFVKTNEFCISDISYRYFFNVSALSTREFDTLKSKKVPQSLEIGLFFCQIFIFII